MHINVLFCGRVGVVADAATLEVKRRAVPLTSFMTSEKLSIHSIMFLSGTLQGAVLAGVTLRFYWVESQYALKQMLHANECS